MGILDYCLGSRSLRTAKLTKRFKSEKTSLRSPVLPTGAPPPVESSPGDVSPPNSEVDLSRGIDAGAATSGWLVGGSISMAERNEVDARCSRVLVNVTKVSNRWPCSSRAVPLRSSTCMYSRSSIRVRSRT